MSTLKLYISLVYAAILFVHTNLHAQQTISADEVLANFSRFQKNYDGHIPLQFKLRYTYANESKPQILLDSTEGLCTISGTNYHYIMDSTETIHNSDYTIILFREDKLMYLYKSAANIAYQPLQMMDSVLKQAAGLSFTQSDAGSMRTISILFPEGLRYKRISFTADTVSNLLLSSEYVVRTEQLMEDPVLSAGGEEMKSYDAYALVKAVFYEYQNNIPDTSWADEKLYFIKEGTELKTTERYKAYRIFSGSPNL